MSLILYLTGVINIIVAIIYGIYKGSIGEFIITVFVCTVITFLLFGIGNIIDNQDTIINYLIHIKEDNINDVVKKCSRCNKKYEAIRKSCPYCGYVD
ncbi:MAG: hypothetical protein N4A50_10410 [Vallitalea sp.]|jgi:hypothetical protein|nr:hypothetical protein [Vallitalea sp.]